VLEDVFSLLLGLIRLSCAGLPSFKLPQPKASKIVCVLCAVFVLYMVCSCASTAVFLPKRLTCVACTQVWLAEQKLKAEEKKQKERDEEYKKEQAIHEYKYEISIKMHAFRVCLLIDSRGSLIDCGYTRVSFVHP
jgi:hypothetical protein